MTSSIQVLGASSAGTERVLTKEALAFVEKLEREFRPRRQELLAARSQRQHLFDHGEVPRFLPETEAIRADNSWRVASCPPDLQKRRVEITGPVERKMMINALNSGAQIFMADFEDSLSPTWQNVVQGQVNLMDAVRRTITFESAGKSYQLNQRTAVLIVRPRGWHLPERHLSLDGNPGSASLIDFGLYFFHNARALLERGSGPYFYLPKMESHFEARLWNDVFNLAQDLLEIPRGTIRATVLIETLPAAFEMDEILYELRTHASGCNAGRWDYIFSLIKKFRNRRDLILPDRAQIGMTVPFMRAYTELLVQTCHKRGAHAMGGMAPFIPSRKNPEINTAALAKVREDKSREVFDGFDGTWVAHPDLVPVAMEIFDKVLGEKPHQKEKLRSEVQVADSQLVDTHVPGAAITEAGFRNDVSVSLQYLNQWLLGNGAAAIFNLMEDAATCEISRAQLWQWITNAAKLDDGRLITRELYMTVRDEELAKLHPNEPGAAGRYREAVEVLDQLVLGDFPEFLTLPAYPYLD